MDANKYTVTVHGYLCFYSHDRGSFGFGFEYFVF